MSNYATTTELQSYLKTQWASAGRTEPIAYQGYTDENLSLAEGNDPWIRISHNEAETNQMTLQNKPIYRSVGVIFVQCFQRAKGGTAKSEQMSDTIENMFRCLEINGVASGLIRNSPGTHPNARRVGVDPAGWFQINVSIPYIRDVQEDQSGGGAVPCSGSILVPEKIKVILVGTGGVNDVLIGANVDPDTVEVYAEGNFLNRDTEYSVTESVPASGNYDTLHPLRDDMFPVGTVIQCFYYLEVS